MDEVFDKVRAVVAQTFNATVEEIKAETSPETLEAWDSMGQLSLTLALEQEFDVQLPPEGVERIKDVKSAAVVVREALAARG
jgi:acyl carrier protein